MSDSGNFFFEFLKLARKFWCSEKKLKIRSTVFLFAALTLLQNAMALWLTHWSASLFDALEQRSMHELFVQIGILGLILVCDISLTGTHLTVKRNLQIWWREWLTEYVFSRWMSDGRHYLISRIPGQHANPDGRIAEDCRIATESAVVLGHSLFFSVVLLISFTELLWSLSGEIHVELGSINFTLYGHLIWIAMAYTALASWLGWRVGLPLTSTTNARQTAEANFRAGLIEAHESSQAIALIHADQCERFHFRSLFRRVLKTWNLQTSAWRNIVMFGTGYADLNKVFPILIASPRYILGQISLGSLMQSAQAFQQMVSALSWPVDSLGAIAEWRASVERILGLLKAIDHIDAQIDRQGSELIQVVRSDQPVLRLKDVSIANFNGTTLVSHINQEFSLGECVRINGNTNVAGKLFRAIAGIRPWGSGVIELPSKGGMFFMPPLPHLPSGTLRSAICYPSARMKFPQVKVEELMSMVGLGHLVDQLNRKENWSATLSRNEQQLLGMVRLLLMRPQWIFLQESFDSLTEEDELRMLALICHQLPNSTILSISHVHDGDSLFSRRVNL